MASSENRGLEGPQSEQKEEEEEEEEEEVEEEQKEKEEEEEALCRNAGLAYSFALFELIPQTKTLHYSRISTSLPCRLPFWRTLEESCKRLGSVYLKINTQHTPGDSGCDRV